MANLKFSVGDKVVCSDDFNKRYYGDNVAIVLGYTPNEIDTPQKIVAIDFGKQLKGAWPLLPPFVLSTYTGTYCYERDLELVKVNDWSVDLI